MPCHAKGVVAVNMWYAMPCHATIPQWYRPLENRLVSFIPSTIGAMLNYYIALGGNVFIGTEISSYSTDFYYRLDFTEATEKTIDIFSGDWKSGQRTAPRALPVFIARKNCAREYGFPVEIYIPCNQATWMLMK
jgi:hypothetical protein